VKRTSTGFLIFWQKESFQKSIHCLEMKNDALQVTYSFTITIMKPTSDTAAETIKEIWNLSVFRLFLMVLAIIPQNPRMMLRNSRISNVKKGGSYCAI
jgi:hypothetical protein